MLKKRILIVMICIYGITLCSGLMVSVMNKGKDLIGILVEAEKTAEGDQIEKEDFSTDETLQFIQFKSHSGSFTFLRKQNFLHHTNLHPSFLLAPETPPPDFV